MFPESKDWEQETIDRAAKISMTSLERLWALQQAVKYLESNRIAGDVVECGVWKGGSSYLVARTLAQLGSTNRELFLFDTFQGMPAPGSYDSDLSGVPAAEILDSQKERKNESLVWAISGLNEVQSNMSLSGYPTERLHFVEGDVMNTLAESAPREIALARLDTDWYESTLFELEVLMPRMVSGGVVIVDDYGHWNGARRAVEEWLESSTFKPLLHRIDYTGRIWTVP